MLLQHHWWFPLAPASCIAFTLHDIMTDSHLSLWGLPRNWFLLGLAHGSKRSCCWGGELVDLFDSRLFLPCLRFMTNKLIIVSLLAVRWIGSLYCERLVWSQVCHVLQSNLNNSNFKGLSYSFDLGIVQDILFKLCKVIFLWNLTYTSNWDKRSLK